MDRTGAGRRLVVALVIGAALVAVLVALQLVDDGGGSARDAEVRVKGVAVSRAVLEGRVADGPGWRVEVTVLGLDGQAVTTTARDGRYRVPDLLAGPVEVSWVGERSGSAAGGIQLGVQRTGRVEITLEPGRNTYDITL